MNSTLTSRDLEFIRNRTFDEISVGDRASTQRALLVRLLQYVRPLRCLRMAVVYPCDEVSLSAAMEAKAAGLIDPVLIAPGDRLLSISEKAGIDLEDVTIEDARDAHDAAAYAVELALKGDVEALMKGSLHTDELMAAVVKSALRADILIVPDLESGNMLAKQLEYFGGAASAGIVVGAGVPIVLTSRTDTRQARIASCGVALVAARRSPPLRAICDSYDLFAGCI